jgi:hypothetical protein
MKMGANLNRRIQIHLTGSKGQPSTIGCQGLAQFEVRKSTRHTLLQDFCHIFLLTRLPAFDAHTLHHSVSIVPLTLMYPFGPCSSQMSDLPLLLQLHRLQGFSDGGIL